MFSNSGKAQELPRCLNELGFAVDIVDHRNIGFYPHKKYDLFIGHEAANFERIARALDAGTAIVYFATGLEWREHNRRQLLRLDEVKNRRGCSLRARMANPLEASSELADAIICVGQRAAESFIGYGNVIGVDNAAFPVQWSGWQTKDYRAGRSSFLFFSGFGNVLKGLDLVLEAFAGTNLEVYICTAIEPDFARAFRRELTEFPNIHVENWVVARSQHFEELVSKCDWVIFPTCTEGQPGSVIECMAHGLLPIISSAANIELPRGGIDIPRLDVEAVRTAALQAIQMDPDEIEAAAKCLVRDSRIKYSPETFRANFKSAIRQVFNQRREDIDL